MLTISTVIYLLCASVFLYSAINYFIHLKSFRKEYQFTLYAFLCLFASAYALFILFKYHSTDVTTCLLMVRGQNFFARMIMVILPWFVGFYANYLPRRVLYFISSSAILLGLAKGFLPPSLVYPHLRGLQYLIAPWGEPLTTLNSDSNFLTYYLYGVYAVLIAFVIDSIRVLWRRGQRSKAWPLILTLTFGFCAFANDIMVDAGVIRNMYMEDYAIYLFVLLVGAWLSGRRMQAEGNYRTLFNALNDAIFVHDARTGKVLDVNETAARMFGTTRQNLVNMDFKLSSADVEDYSVAKAYEKIRLAATEGPQVFEWLSRRVDNGKLFSTEVGLRLEVIDNHPVVLASVRDISLRKKVEEAAREGEQRLQLFEELTEEAIMIHDQGVIVEVNQALCRLLDYGRSEIIGMPLSRFMEDMSVEDTKTRISKGYPEGTYEIGAKRKDGTIIPILVHGRDFMFRGRKMRASSGWDITERKKNEEALRQSEANFRTLIEQSPDAILVHQEGKIIYVNRKCVELLGYRDPHDLLGKLPEATVYPADLAFVQERMQMTRKGGENRPAIVRMLKQNGQMIETENSSISILYQGHSASMVLIHDIEERRKSEEALRKSEAKFRSLIENSYDLITVLDKSGKRLYESPSLERVLGYKPGEREGFTFDSQPPEEQVIARELFEKVLANPGISIQAQLKSIRKDGRVIDGDMIVTNLLNDPAVGGIVINARDVTEQKQTQEALKQSEAKFRGLIENSHDMITVVDAEGRRLYESPSLERFLGYKPGERKGTSFELQIPEDVERNRKLFAEVLAHPGVPYRTETGFKHKDGHYIHAEVVLTNLLNDPSVRGIVVNSRDVTEKKKAEEALQQKERYFRALIEKSYDAIVLLDREGKVGYVSPGMKYIYGYTPEERKGQSAFDLVEPSKRPEIMRLFDELLKNPGTSGVVQVRFQHKDGQWVTVDVRATNLLEDPDVAGIVVNYRDVTEKMKAEEALRQSEEKFRSLIENSNDVISLVGADGNAVFVSPSIKKVMGYDSAERVGKSFMEIVHPEDRERIGLLFKEFLGKPGATSSAEARALHKDGTWRTIEAVATNLLQHPTIKGIIFNYRDVTEKKQSEQMLMKFERLSAIGQMAAGMAHEIRNPLSAISTIAQVLKRKEQKTREKGFADTILEQSERLERLIQDTLGFARNEKTLSKEPCALKGLLESSLRLSQIQFGPSHYRIRVKWDLPAEEIVIWAHPQRVQQILVNLCLNAFQVMPEGGTLTIGLKTVGKSALITVADTGVGIKEPDLGRIFEPFFTTKKTGSGLGLALSQRIAKEYGGEITVSRGQVCGTVFTLRLLLGEEEKA